jgi:hypothetical protein
MSTTSNETIVIEDSERVFPCRCGETHRGDYGHYDWAHHNCFHASGLHELLPGYLMCPDCGLTFHIVPASTTGADAPSKEETRGPRGDKTA